ncbi:MAG: hypothetical protein AUG51_03030 [Acidobacteria bacterium 13_1_20CM_3_53_8]|nr:MAG: hypothetical protein AUG51_03030 [Acidobacteria bacterium 13_1_20CM_3_53_8]
MNSENPKPAASWQGNPERSLLKGECYGTNGKQERAETQGLRKPTNKTPASARQLSFGRVDEIVRPCVKTQEHA